MLLLLAGELFVAAKLRGVAHMPLLARLVIKVLRAQVHQRLNWLKLAEESRVWLDILWWDLWFFLSKLKLLLKTFCIHLPLLGDGDVCKSTFFVGSLLLRICSLLLRRCSRLWLGTIEALLRCLKGYKRKQHVLLDSLERLLEAEDHRSLALGLGAQVLPRSR